jgi:hypothetical protein
MGTLPLVKQAQYLLYLLHGSSSTGTARRIRSRYCVGDTQQQAPRTALPTPPFLNRILRRLRLVPYADFERPRIMFKNSNTMRYDGIADQLLPTAPLRTSSFINYSIYQCNIRKAIYHTAAAAAAAMVEGPSIEISRGSPSSAGRSEPATVATADGLTIDRRILFFFTYLSGRRLSFPASGLRMDGRWTDDSVLFDLSVWPSTIVLGVFWKRREG